jgi:molybdopterin-synthase adenylyltransferase
VDDTQLLRYSRHLLLDEIGVAGQQRLLRAHALVIGCGGLGSPAALYLGSAGVGRLTLVDDDHVDLTNLQRQIAHASTRIGLPKAQSLAASVQAINPGVAVQPVLARAEGEVLARLVAGADVVLDCSDNWRTRQAVNAACVRQRRALVSGAAVGFDGQVSVFDRSAAATETAPCYACLFHPDAEVADAACATLGVFAPLVGIIGAVQAAEALKLLAGCGDPLRGRLLMLDARRMAWESITLARDPGCPVCARP